MSHTTTKGHTTKSRTPVSRSQNDPARGTRLPTLSIGYFSVPGQEWISKTHLVENGKPKCGARLPEQAEFRWCAWVIRVRYIGCAQCREMASQILTVPQVKVRW